MSAAKSRVSVVRISGPLASFADGFRCRLTDLGYTPLSTVNQMRLMGHLSDWLAAGQLGVGDLSDERVQEYLLARRAAGRTGFRSRRALVPLLEFLSACEVLPVAPPSVAVGSGSEVVLAAFHRYLLAERGLACSTASAYVARAGRFLAGCAADGDLRGVTVGDVTRAVLAESATLSVGSVQFFVAAVRSFLRFACLQGLVDVDLSAAALPVTGRRHSSLPQGITRSAADALLRSPDRRRSIGRRDHAVLLVLLRLGLRASEVATLALDDIDWRAGQVVVHGKNSRQEALPLPVDVGEAIAGYLQRGRPKTSRREVFLTALAPVTGLSRTGVSLIVRRACARAGVTPVGAHRLRHTMACGMVAGGVPLAEIGQVMRHAHLSSTATYARVDLAQLRGLALPWPGGSGR